MDFVSRVIQLDAITLDDEFFKLIKGLINKAAAKLNVVNFLARYSSETDLLIKFVIWKYTVHDGSYSLGQKLLGVKFQDSRVKLRLLFIIEAVVPYVIKKAAQYLKLEDSLKWPEDILRACQIINFCLFLVTNRYPTLALRLCRLRIIPAYTRLHPSVGYSYQIRELLWHQFADFLMIVLPLVNVHRIKGFLRNWRGTSTRSQRPPSIEHGSSPASSLRSNGVSKCCVCHQDAIIPKNSERHTYCYYCLTSNRMADPNFNATECTHCRTP